MLLVMLFVPFASVNVDNIDSVSSSEKLVDTSVEPNPTKVYFVEVTKSQVYHANGRIYIATKYSFNPDALYEYEVNGEFKTIDFNMIIAYLRSYFTANKTKQFIYNESTPNNIIIIDKMYNNRTEFNHEQGITGDEKYEPLDVYEQDFWYTTYVTKNKSYLADGGKQTIENNYRLIGQAMFGIDTVDLSRVRFNYCYGTDYKSISTNGRMIKIDNMYYHIFENINEDSEIILYQRVQNSPNWYGVIIGTSVAVILLGFLIYLVVRKRRKNG